MADFLTRIGRSLGISNEEGARIGASLATGNLGQAALTTLTSLGDEGRFSPKPVDVSAPPAGVDSPASLSQVSQTSMTGGATGDGIGVFGMGNISRRTQPVQAGFGLAGPALSFGRNILRGPGFGVGAGAAAGFVADSVVDIFGREKKLVITRRLQREVKKVFMLSGGSFAFVSANSMRLFGKSLTEDQVVQVLFKTFKNQGPYVTKAAVRKTRSTIRKMETLCDLKDRLCPPKRAAPRRRAATSSTRVLQVK